MVEVPYPQNPIEMLTNKSLQNVLVILGHGSNNSFSAAVADTYTQAAKSAGHAVRILRLGELQFDALLHGSNPHQQALEPDLLAAQDSIQWAQHIAWVFPVWWGSVPALLKGFLDRTFIHPTKTLMLGPIIHSTVAQREAWLQKVGALGASL